MGIVQRLLSLPSNPEHIRKLESFVKDVSSPYNLDQGSYGKILICLTEAVNNAIYHGNDCQESKDVLVKCHQNGKSIKFWVTDQGNGFNAEMLPSPIAVENLRQEGGRGLFLMKHLADKLEYSNNGSTLELWFYV